MSSVPSQLQVDEFTKNSFDYIVIGGGAGGLPVANRLSEDPNVSVGILEAGFLHTDDSTISTPQFFGRATGNAKYDWLFKTEPQPNAHGRVIAAPRGKLMGGSTSINFMAWDRACKEEYDAWKKLADPKDAWDWDTLLPYFKRTEEAVPESESMDPYPGFSLSDQDVINGSFPKGEVLGTSGAIKTSYSPLYADVIQPYVKAWNAVGVPTNANPFGGNAVGVYNLRRTVDIRAGKRVDATSAYYNPASSRANLTLLTGAHVTKILFHPQRDGEGKLSASGVEFLLDGNVYTVAVAKEVILSAGSIQTPQLLELSGIGNETLLANLGIQTLVNLPGVGENLQDHIFAPIQFLLKPGYKTFDQFRNHPEFAAEQQRLYDSTKTGWLTASDTTAVYNPLAKIVDASKFSSLISELETSISQQGDVGGLRRKQYEIQLEWLKKGNVPNVETIVFSKGVVNPQEGSSYFVVLAGIQHPFSRGSIHINSTDPLKPPIIDPNYLSHPFDLQTLVAGYRSMERLAATEQLKEVIEKQTVPPVPLEKDEDLQGFIRQAFSSGSHLMGTAALARQDLGGVVGNDLKVYGTRNLRVVDASLIPIPCAAHIQATIYAIAERAADLIKRDYHLMEK